jgi:2-dehydro-3-deoxy-L-rhamnonate dehydrogenase (NAD+)
VSFFDLTGQTAIVTGAATGIGEAVALRLASAGAFVLATDLDEAGAAASAQKICAAAGAGRARGMRIDVTRGESAAECVRSVLDATGRIDILVNNAGIAGRAAPLWEQTIEEWHRVLAVNLDGVFHCSRAAIVPMRERKYGRIVNIASIAGKEGNPNMTAYSASKAGVIAFTKSLAKEVAQEGICVNSVTPAVVRTKILEQLTEQQVAYMTERIPMRRTGTPEEIAAVVHFLASPDCSFVTGQCYDASGGRATY